jgi:hypothetical protein
MFMFDLLLLVSLAKTTIQTKYSYYFDVDSMSLTDSGVILYGNFKINNATGNGTFIRLDGNGEINQLIQTNGSLQTSSDTIVKGHTWSFTNSQLQTDSKSTITSLASLVAINSNVVMAAAFLLPASNVSVTLQNCFGVFNHRIPEPSYLSLNIIGGYCELGNSNFDATNSIAVANISISQAAVVSLTFAPTRTSYRRWLNANIDLFDSSKLQVDNTVPVTLQGSLTFHGSDGRLVCKRCDMSYPVDYTRRAYLE